MLPEVDEGEAGAGHEGIAHLFFVFVALAWRRLRTIDAAADMPQVQIQLLRSIPIFNALSAPELEGLARALVPVEATAGTTLITEGEPGEGFGEIALIQDVPRTAAVVALTDVSLYLLKKEPSVLALTGHAPVARAAGDLVAQGLEELEAI